MMRTALAVTVALTCACFVVPAQAQEKPPRMAEIPRTFRGTFLWDGSTGGYDVTLIIDKVRQENDTIHFVGSHTYPTAVHKMKVEGRIDLRTRKVNIRESEPSQPGAIIDGEFVGSISQDLSSIECTWSPQGAGAKGTLKLSTKINNQGKG